MVKSPLKVLFLGSDEHGYLTMRRYLWKIKRFKSTMEWIADAGQGAARLLARRFDACLVDSSFGRKNSLQLLRGATRRGCAAPIIMLSNKRDRGCDTEFILAGASDYLIKPEIDPIFLERSLRYSITHKKKEQALRTAKRLQQNAREKLEKIVRSINEEMDTAQKVQESMLPRHISEMGGLRVATAFLPCGRIGGDLYDVVKIDETRTCFLMFDVVGHGIPAALISAMVKVSFSKNITPPVSTAEIMERVNTEIVNFFKEKRHITAFIAVYDTLTGEIAYTGGGHPSPIVIRAQSRHLENLSSRGLPLGMFAEVKYEVSKMRLEAGDCIVFYTDGLTESHNLRDASLGKKRLEEVLRGSSGERSPEDILGAIVKSRFSFRGTAARSDDITVVVAKVI
jgi:serine phosphatase RsbU (regulator of sigma subunit)